MNEFARTHTLRGTAEKTEHLLKLTKWSFTLSLAQLLRVFAILSVLSAHTISVVAEEVSEPQQIASNVESPLEMLLASKPTSREYKETQDCITKSRIRDHEILNQRLVVLTMRGRERSKLLIQFNRSCHGLGPKVLINMESRGSSRLCSGDWIRTEVFEFGQRSWGPRCPIPGFEPITDHQLALLREALVNGRVK